MAAAHKYHVDRTFTDIGHVHALIRQYRGEIQRDVTSSDAHIYLSRPTGKWILVRKKNGVFEVGFYNECPCDLL